MVGWAGRDRDDGGAYGRQDRSSCRDLRPCPGRAIPDPAPRPARGVDSSRTLFRPFQFENVATDGNILLLSESLPDDEFHVYEIIEDEEVVKAGMQGPGGQNSEGRGRARYAYGSGRLE